MDPLSADALATLTRVVGGALLDFVWQGALVAAVYAGLRHALKRATPAAHVVLGQLAMLALLVLPIATTAWRLRRGFPLQPPEGASAVMLQDALWAPAAAMVDAGTNGDWLVWLVCAWFAGVLVLSLRVSLQWLHFRRLCRTATPVVGPWPRLFRRLAARLGVGRPVVLRESPRVDTPMLFGWLKPVVLLPAGLLLHLPRDQVIPLLLHELAHVRRLDFVFNLLQVAIQTLFYFHPAVHWIARRLSEDRELACDDLVLRAGADRLSYAHALARLAQIRAYRPMSSMPRPVLAAVAGALLHRIGRIVDRPDSDRQPASPSQGWLVLGIVITLLMLAMQSNQRPGDLPPAFDLRAPLLTDIPLAQHWLPIAIRNRLEQPIPLAAPPAGFADADPADAAVAARAAGPGPVPASSTGQEPIATSAAPQLPGIARAIPEAAGIDAAGIEETAGFAPTPGVAATGPAEETASGPPTASAITVLRQVAPDYPQSARHQGQEGSVLVSFTLDAQGRPTRVRVEQARPRGVFERSARQAMAGWRFAVGPDHDPRQRLRQAFDFRLSENGGEAVDECQIVLGSRICR